jgi:Domain of unknown function (DUF4404)
MINDTLTKIEARLRAAESVPDARRRELLDLIGTLRGEISELSQTDQEHAQSIAGFTQVSTHEATRPAPNPELVRVSLAGLTGSVAGFEKSHPRLVQIVNSLSTTLSNLGI